MIMKTKTRTKETILTALVVTAVLGQQPLAAGEAEATMDPVSQRLLSVKSVSGLALSPDGERAVYVLGRNDLEKDTSLANLWLVDVESGDHRPLASSKAGESSPQWRPDGKAIGFLSNRHDPDEGTTQVWVLPMGGGEAIRVTDFEGDVEDFQFSPDGKKFAVTVFPPDPFEAPDEDAEIQTAPPIVIDRFAFKTDSDGYLTRRRQLHLVEIASGATERLAENVIEPFLPSFSPDGETLAFVAKGGKDPDRTDNFDVYTVAPRAGAEASQLIDTTAALCHADGEQRPVWSNDGAMIACVAWEYDRDGYYAQGDLALINVENGTARNLTRELDLNIDNPKFSRNDRYLWVTLEHDRTLQLARIRIKTGKIELMLKGKLAVADFDLAGKDRVVAKIGRADRPYELFAVEYEESRQLTRHNDALLAEHPWQGVEEISYKSAGGTTINGFLMRPVGAQPDRMYPTVLRLHGGPVSQFAHEPRKTPQFLAEHGFAVVMVNPRGSSGRGIEFSKEIWGAWGSVDVEDVLAGVDHVVGMGIADPDRLVVGGWSYGGMLTNYVIASDTRFRAASSGASIANAWAGCALAGVRADVPGAAHPGDPDQAGHLSGAGSQPGCAQLQRRHLAAPARLVQPVPGRLTVVSSPIRPCG
jgi:dipeptidyl aminopeptidase/acylaminoacyl peptidase